MMNVRKKSGLFAPHAFDYIVSAVLLLFALGCLYPFVHMLLISFASEGDYYSAVTIVIPRHFTLNAYAFVLLESRIGLSFLESVLITGIYIVYALFLTSLGAYALTKTQMPGHKIFFAFILISMFFGGGLIPFYLTVRGLGLIDSWASVIIPFGINSFYMIILRNFFYHFFDSVLEACKLDGANEFTIFLRFVLPLSKAALITIGLFYLVDKWNDWYWPMIFINSSEKYPLALEVRNILSGTSSIDYSASDLSYRSGKEAATIILSIIPIAMIVPFAQKFLVRGVMIGSVKE